MRKILLGFLLVLLLTSFVYAVPYPYGGYDLPTTGDLKQIYEDTRLEYSVLPFAEDGYYPWFVLSKAELWGPALIDANLNMRAEFQFWTEAEKKEKREEQFRLFVDDGILIKLILFSDPDVRQGYRYVDVEDGDSAITRIVLETDKGQRYLPTITLNAETELINGEFWGGENMILFPRFDNKSEIITPETKWIKIWVISGMSRIYFQFNFDQAHTI